MNTHAVVTINIMLTTASSTTIVCMGYIYMGKEIIQMLNRI